MNSLHYHYKIDVPWSRRIRLWFVLFMPLFFFILPFMVWHHGGSIVAVIVLSVVATLFYLIIVTLAVRSHTRTTISRFGIESDAKVISVQYKQGKVNPGMTGLPTQDIEVRLNVTPSGMPAFQSSDRLTIPVVALPQYQVGNTVTVRFDPRRMEFGAVVTTEPKLDVGSAT